MHEPQILHYSAFTADPRGGNPAGVVLDARGLDAAAMQAVAARLGYSESAFLSPRGDDEFDLRFYAPTGEVRFCGHATIATAAALAERAGPGRLRFHTRAGEVRVATRIDDGIAAATLTSVEPYVESEVPDLATSLAHVLRLDADALDPGLPTRIAYAGGREFIVGVRTRAQLAALDYDFEGLLAWCNTHDLQGGIVIWRESATVFHARGPFPVGGVVEDPATGAAAAALGAYLRELGPGRTAGHGDGVAGRGHGPPQPAGGRHRPAGRDRGDGSGGGDRGLTDRPFPACSWPLPPLAGEGWDGGVTDRRHPDNAQSKSDQSRRT
ncbi:PhzF family phenazine biosynthesis protein [Agrilutibacter solisilvae]|uniref:PhzF family phenazine biosynthesis isomerase n=1 Tax=Agrilutibacter solisilvae TaxID=2763317 RepID=A0A975AT14_9GAMM|nr:PhzF family phenazine biosynthesis isomerase [Lysobacter solisilvae]QSX78535.1 PhzF family phenazine biosynthesis isomerase [Lysobacter solisilvae]